MIKKTFSLLLLIASLLTVSSIGFAQTGTWETIKTLQRAEVAIQTNDGNTTFGILESITDNDLVLWIAEKKDMSKSKETITKNNIKKIWRANLRFGGNNLGKGALIGASLGAGSGFGYLMANRRNGDGQTSLAVPVYAIYGAGIGAAIGFFAKKSHKKKKLVYSI